MIVYVLTGFILGFFIPYMSRRFAKFMPATPAYAILQILRPIKFIYNSRHKKLYLAYLERSFVSGLIASGISYLFIYRYGFSQIWWHIAFVFILMLLAEIDGRMLLLPDILTVPLLILGFAYATLGNGWVIPAESAIGALIGYALPVVVGILILGRNKDAFGGGDIKFLAALGAWLGVETLLYVIALASIIMFVYSLARSRKFVAFGPGLAFSAIIVALLSY
ncbi:MAG: prepilin peptidase [Alphaproteobacteria bacterium]|nr:prepilin peptidase [Alphaproteobacteria bacterium]